MDLHKKSVVSFLTFYLTCNVLLNAQIGGNIPGQRMTYWDKSGITGGIPVHLLENSVDINSYYLPEDGSFFDNAVRRAFQECAISDKYVIFFPEGTYNFTVGLELPPGIVIKGEGSDKSKIVFNLNNINSSCISVLGTTGEEAAVTDEITNGQDFVSADNIPSDFESTLFFDLYQGADDFGEDNVGFKQYQKAQLLRIKSIEGNKMIFGDPIRLNYSLTDEWGLPLKIKTVFPSVNCGIEDLFITREDTPPPGGGAIISFNNSYNCWVSGCELFMGANHVIEIRRSKNIEVRGCYLHRAYNYGEGGNGYGVFLTSNATDCLIEDNIFESFRHSMLVQSSSNGNVFGYNASVNKPDDNWNEASLSIHGHYAYFNLFESNYAEYANADFVWGSNGPYNTFLRNYIYHEGYFNNSINNQQLQIEKGTDKNNVVANLAFAFADLNSIDNYIRHNYKMIDLPSDSIWSEFSYYKYERPYFISEEYSWPCFGLKTSESSLLPLNKIPAMDRLNQEKKTVSAHPLTITSLSDNIGDFIFTLHPNYPNPFNPSTTISFDLSVRSMVRLDIFDILGSKIFTLLNERMEAGAHSIVFTAAGFSSGVYFYVLTSITGNGKVYSNGRKMTYIK